MLALCVSEATTLAEATILANLHVYKEPQITPSTYPHVLVNVPGKFQGLMQTHVGGEQVISRSCWGITFCKWYHTRGYLPSG